MTLSKDDRDLNKRLAFELMLAELDDRYVFEADFYIDAPPFGDHICKTTWSDLEDDGYIVRPRSKGFNGYQLNSDGWIQGLALLNRLQAPPLDEHIPKLMATLKGYISKSRDDAFVPLQQVIKDSEIPAATGAHCSGCPLLYPNSPPHGSLMILGANHLPPVRSEP